MGLYQEVYLEDGTRYRPRLRTDLDKFLWQWLQNLQEQELNPHQSPEEQHPADESGGFSGDTQDATPEAKPSTSEDSEIDSFPQYSIPGA